MEHCPGDLEPFCWCKTCCCWSSPDTFLLAGWPVTLLIGTKQLHSVPIFFFCLFFVFSPPGSHGPRPGAVLLSARGCQSLLGGFGTRCFFHLLRRVVALVVEKEMALELLLCKLDFRKDGMRRAICVTGKLLFETDG